MCRKLLFLLLSSLLVFNNCALHKVEEQIEPPPQTPERFTISGTATPPDTWWASFHQPELNQVVDSALGSNLELRIAWSRLRQFRATARRVNTSPSVDLNASGQRGRSFFNFGGQPITFTNNDFNLDASASYEVDLWKRLSSLDKAEALQVKASREDAEATALALAGNLTRTWFALAAQREQKELLLRQVETNQKFVTVLETRFANALAGAVEVFQARRQLAAIESQIPNTEARIATLSNALAVLSGQAPRGESYPAAKALPALPPLPATGIPADLLRNRPDIRAAGARIAAADHQLAAAIAARYPSLRLTGSTGYSSADFADLLDNWIWRIAGSILAPIIDGGARKAEAERARAVVEERVVQYQQTMLRGLQEVEDALALERGQKAFIAELEEQLSVAREAYDAGRRRYLEGVGDFLTVLTETQAVQQIEQEMVRARSDLIANRINLYQALGGGWTVSLPEPGNGVEGDQP